jgi:hypothetical protein
MGTIIILVIIGGIIWAIVSGINGRQEVKERGEIMEIKVNNLSNFNATQKVVGVNNLYTFAVDDKKREVAYIEENQETFIPYDEIISVEVIEDNTVIASKSTMRTIGGAVVGGALAGGAGAVVGGLSGNTNMKKKVKMVQVKLRLRDISNPTLFINCFDYMTMANGQEVKPDGMLGFIYKQGLEHAQQIADLVSVIIDDVDRSQKQTTNNNSSSSVADELSKLADLKAKGILTEDEFNSQKSKLLNL